MDELNLSLTPSSLHAPSFLFDSPNAVVNAPSFLLPTEYSPYRESVVLPEMPHNNLNKHMILADMTAFSGETGVTYEDARENLLYAPLFAVPLRYAPTPSLSSVFFTRPLVSLNIGRLPYTSVSMARKAIRPLMPHRMRIRHFTWYEATMFSFDTGTTLDDEKLICPYENEFALTGSIPLSISDSPLNALLPDG